MRSSLSKGWRKFLTMTSVIALLVVCTPILDGVGSAVAQTKTNTSKKKGATSSGTQKKSSSSRKKTSTAGKNSSSTRKMGTQPQKKSSSVEKKQNPTVKKQVKQGKKQTTQGKAKTSSKGNGAKTNARPKSSAEAKKIEEATQREIQQTKEKLRLNEEQIKTGLSDLNRLSAEIATGKKQVDGLQQKVTALNSKITYLGQEITKNEAELKLMREEYLKAVKKMRLTKKNQSTLAFIFASENFNQAMRRIRYMRQFSAWKERKSTDIDNKIEQLGNERESLAKAKDAQTVALTELTKSQAQLEDNHKKQENLVATLRQNGDALQAHLVAKQKEANRLKETISALIAQEQAKAEAERRAREKAEAERKAKAEAERIAREKEEAERKAAAEKALADKAAADKAQKAKSEEDKKEADRKFAEAKSKADEKLRKQQEKDKKNSEKSARKKSDRKRKKENIAKETVKSSEPLPNISPRNTENTAGVNFASLRGNLPRPVDGSWRITNPFGRHAMPEMPEIEYDNPGIDAEVAKGVAVKAVCGGKVSGVYKLAGFGNVVIVNHGDYYTVYGNLASTNVAVGTEVGGGHTLGSAGSDPDDPRRGSVHFEVWKGREKQNPSAWLR